MDQNVIDPVAQATAAAQMEHVNYRIVSGSEMLLMKPLFEKLNWAMPDPDMAKVVVAEAGMGTDAVILGFTVVQFITHAEPMWVHANLRGTGVAEGLAEHVTHYIEHDCHIKRYVVVAKEGSFSARLAESVGMRPLKGMSVFVKQLD